MRSPRHYNTLSRLTARQLEVMEAIADGHVTPAQLRHRLGLKSDNALDNHLLALEAKWLVVRAPTGAVSLTKQGEERLDQRRLIKALAEMEQRRFDPKAVAP